MTACEGDYRRSLDEWRELSFGFLEAAAAKMDGCEGVTNFRQRGSNWWFTANVIAGLAHGIEGKAEADIRQRFPQYATGACLDDFAEAWCNSGRAAAEQASGLLRITGTPGAVLPASRNGIPTTISSAAGVEYRLEQSITIGTDGSGSGTIRALLPGTDGNLAPNSAVQIDAATAGINSSALVGQPGVVGGTEQESDEELRARVLQCIREAPGAGTCRDYEQWALEMPGVTRAWAYGSPGSVKVYFTMDSVYPDRWGIPQPGDAEALQEHLFGQDGRAPCTLGCGRVCTPLAKAVNVVIDQLEPNTAEVRAAVAANVEQWFVEKTTVGGRICASDLSAAISAVAGECCHVLVEPQNVICADNELPIPGKITITGATC